MTDPHSRSAGVHGAGATPDGPPDHGGWIVTAVESPPRCTVLDPPRPAVARTGLYDGSQAVVPVVLVALAGDQACVQQAVVRDGRPHTWNAWIGSDSVRLVKRRGPGAS